MARHGVGANVRARLYLEGRLVENGMLDGYVSGGPGASTGTSGYLVSKISQIQEDQQERFFDTLLAVIDDIGNVNPYYTCNRNRFRLTDRILRAHAGKVEKLFQLSLLSDFLTGLS